MISPAFSRSELPNQTQKILLCLLATLLPPLPIFILTGPNYTVKTKQFLISCVLTLTFYFYVIGIIHSVYFVLITFPKARLAPHGSGYYGNVDLESRTTIDVPAAAGADAHGAASDAPDSGELNISEEANEPFLPSYREVEGSVNTYPRDSKVSHGDNKVQS